MEIKTIQIKDQINTYFKDYALYVIEKRGIPNFYDALNPAQRLILLNAPDHLEKTIGLVGSVMKTGLYHHADCLGRDTEINLADGTIITIGDWCDKYPNIRLLVKCVDENNIETFSLGHSPRIGQITDIMYKIHIGDDVIECTGNHLFMTKIGWKKAMDLTDDDEILNL